MNHCEENDSSCAALVAATLSLVTFARIPPHHLLRLQVRDLCDESTPTAEKCKVMLTSDDGRFLRHWLDLRGTTPGLLLSLGEGSLPLSLATMSGLLAKYCRQAGVRPFSSQDLSRTQAWVSCGEWAYPCGCDVRTSAEAFFPDGRPSDIPRVQYLRRMQSPKRRDVTKSLNAFIRVLQAGATLASLDWHQVGSSGYAHAISTIGVTCPPQRVRAIRSHLHAVMRAERAYGSLREDHYWDLQSVSWKRSGNQNVNELGSDSL